jgi:glycosyltransferase involved in cell wall biosynthesis
MQESQLILAPGGPLDCGRRDRLASALSASHARVLPPDSRPMISVLLATYNGAKTLERVLARYEALHAPPGGYEIIVVDNASTDATPAVLRDHAQRLPLLAMRTEQRGKNRSLNAGLARCTGDLILFTDDDALPEPDLLLRHCATAAAQPDFDLFGGHIDPDWPSPCPEWIDRLVHKGAVFALTPPDLKTGPVQADKLWGPNMAVRRRVFDAGHRFDESVGPAAGQYMMGSETEFTGRVESLGYRAWFDAEARVGHIIRPHQMEREWIVQRGFRLGRGLYRHEQKIMPPGVAMIRGVPRWKYREYLDAHWRALTARLRSDFDQLFLADWDRAILEGYFAEARNVRVGAS